MATVGAKHYIACLQRLTNPYRHSFLPNREMYRALDLVRGIDTDNFLLCTTNEIERTVDFFLVHGINL